MCIHCEEIFHNFELYSRHLEEYILELNESQGIKWTLPRSFMDAPCPTCGADDI